MLRVKNTIENQKHLLKLGYTWRFGDAIRHVRPDLTPSIRIEGDKLFESDIAPQRDHVFKIIKALKEGYVVKVLDEYKFTPFSHKLEHTELLDQWIEWLGRGDSECLLN